MSRILQFHVVPGDEKRGYTELFALTEAGELWSCLLGSGPWCRINLPPELTAVPFRAAMIQKAQAVADEATERRQPFIAVAQESMSKAHQLGNVAGRIAGLSKALTVARNAEQRDAEQNEHACPNLTELRQELEKVLQRVRESPIAVEYRL